MFGNVGMMPKFFPCKNIGYMHLYNRRLYSRNCIADAHRSVCIGRGV